MKGEGRGSRIAKKPTTYNHIHVSQALNIDPFFSHGDHQLPAGKQLIGALKNTTPAGPSHLLDAIDAWSNTCMLPYHFKIYIVSKLCLTSTTCACPCISSPFRGKNLMGEFLFSSIILAGLYSHLCQDGLSLIRRNE